MKKTLIIFISILFTFITPAHATPKYEILTYEKTVKKIWQEAGHSVKTLSFIYSEKDRDKWNNHVRVYKLNSCPICEDFFDKKDSNSYAGTVLVGKRIVIAYFVGTKFNDSKALRDMALHEYTHAVQIDLMGFRFDQVKCWYVEGLSRYTENILNPEYMTKLNEEMIWIHSRLTHDWSWSNFIENSDYTYSPMCEKYFYGYSLGWKITDTLMKDGGLRKTISLMKNIRNNSWDKAFYMTYGYSEKELLSRIFAEKL